MNNEFIRRLDEVTISDIGLVGGKNASIGEMIQNLSAANVCVPGGFAVTSKAFDFFLKCVVDLLVGGHAAYFRRYGKDYSGSVIPLGAVEGVVDKRNPVAGTVKSYIIRSILLHMYPIRVIRDRCFRLKGSR